MLSVLPDSRSCHSVLYFILYFIHFTDCNYHLVSVIFLFSLFFTFLLICISSFFLPAWVLLFLIWDGNWDPRPHQCGPLIPWISCAVKGLGLPTLCELWAFLLWLLKTPFPSLWELWELFWPCRLSQDVQGAQTIAPWPKSYQILAYKEYSHHSEIPRVLGTMCQECVCL